MQRSADLPDNLSELERSELIGLPVRVAASNDPTLLDLNGAVVDETMKTLTIETHGDRKVVGKLGQTFAFNADGNEVLIQGEVLAHRPQDRIKKARVKR